MIERGELFLRRISLSRNKIANLCHTFIKDGARILTHAYSRVVLRVLEEAVKAKKRFSVYITESQPDLSGQVSRHWPVYQHCLGPMHDHSCPWEESSRGFHGHNAGCAVFVVSNF